jgi:hypothetical protein
MINTMKFTLLIIFSILYTIYGQSLESKYKDLAHYCIINYALSEQMSDGKNQTLKLLPANLEIVSDIIKNQDFRYKIELLDTLGNYEFITITDSTNFQLHALHQTTWAVDSDSSISGNCIALYELGFELFVNKYLYERIEKYNKLSIVRVYNKIELGNNRIEIYDPETNLKSFELIENEYRLNKKNQYNKILTEKSYYGRDAYRYETFYRENSWDEISYYHIMFEFEWDGFSVTRTLLYQIPI